MLLELDSVQDPHLSFKTELEKIEVTIDDIYLISLVLPLIKHVVVMVERFNVIRDLWIKLERKNLTSARSCDDLTCSF